jgi:rhamnose transport system substrate-binding protein
MLEKAQRVALLWQRHRPFMIGVMGASAVAVSVGACGSTGSPADKASSSDQCKRIAMVPKTISDPYFKAAFTGAQKAAKELGMTVDLKGPATADTAAEVQVIEQLLPQHYCALTVSALDPGALAPVLERAQKQGIKVTTFDADSQPAARTLFLNQATFDAIGQTIVRQMAEQTGGKGTYAIVTSTLTAPNQSAWVKAIRKTIKAEYPEMKIAAVIPANADQSLARTVTLSYLRGHPKTTGIMTVDGNALVGVAQAIKDRGLTGKVAATGIGVPSLSRGDLKAGILKSFILWNPVDIGYAAVYMTKGVVDGSVKPGDSSMKAGRLGALKLISQDTALLGPPTVFTLKNVDDFTF